MPKWMTLQEVMAELNAMGTAQNRKVYARHGAGDDTFGVSFAGLDRLKRRIGRDHALAHALWATRTELNAWVKEISYYVHADLLARYFASASPLA